MLVKGGPGRYWGHRHVNNTLCPLLISPSTRWPHLAEDIFWCIFLNEKSHNWSLFLRVKLAISQHPVPSHYLNQCWSYSQTHICGTRGDELTITSVLWIWLYYVINAGCDHKLRYPTCGRQFPSETNNLVAKSVCFCQNIESNSTVSEQIE